MSAPSVASALTSLAGPVPSRRAADARPANDDTTFAAVLDDTPRAEGESAAPATGRNAPQTAPSQPDVSLEDDSGDTPLAGLDTTGLVPSATPALVVVQPTTAAAPDTALAPSLSPAPPRAPSLSPTPDDGVAQDAADTPEAQTASATTGTATDAETLAAQQAAQQTAAVTKGTAAAPVQTATIAPVVAVPAKPAPPGTDSDTASSDASPTAPSGPAVSDAATAPPPAPADAKHIRDIVQRDQGAQTSGQAGTETDAAGSDTSSASTPDPRTATSPAATSATAATARPSPALEQPAAPPALASLEPEPAAVPVSQTQAAEARAADVAQSLSLSTTSQAAINATAQIAAQIVKKLEARSTRFEIALTPDDLGRVDVTLNIDADGQLAARLAFDNPVAATDLRARVDELRRQLQDAGFTVADDALSFAQRDPSAGQGGAFDRHPDPRNARAFGAATRLSADADAAAAPPRWISLTLTPDRVDMKV